MRRWNAPPLPSPRRWIRLSRLAAEIDRAGQNFKRGGKQADALATALGDRDWQVRQAAEDLGESLVLPKELWAIAGERQLGAGDLVLGDDRRGPTVRGEQFGEADSDRAADRVEYHGPAGWPAA